MVKLCSRRPCIEPKPQPTTQVLILSLQAACLANGIAVNHPFLDGNKRSAWAACVAFLRLNGHAPLDDALEPLAEQLIAQHELTDRAQGDVLLADWLRARLE